MARYALVIGIAEYDSRYLDDLKKAEGDARAIAKLLKAHGQCETAPKLLRGRVTTKQLGAALQAFFKQAKHNEAIIYFTGHGITVRDVFGGAEGFLATSDCGVTVDDGQPVDQKQAISFDSLNKLIKASELSNLVMMIDACHSGDFIERSLVETGFSAFGSKQDYFLITACRGDEQGWVKKGADHSVFTGAVLDSLVREKADEEGCVTGDRLFDQVQSALKGSRQEPVRFGKGRSLSIVQFRPEVQTVTVSEDCPYQGLEAFTPETAQFFFGRQDTVRLLKERLSQFNFVPVIGASGSGKSSVVRAGLIPALGDEWYVLEPIKPSAEPMAALRGAMRTLFKRKTDLNKVTTLLNPEGLGPVLEMVPNSPMLPAGGAKVLLVIDQFEEVFTVCSLEEERSQFIECITAIQEIDDSPLAIVTTMRADFVEPWLDYGELVQTIQDQAVWLGRLQGEDLVRAIAQPAKRQGYEFGPGLLELILEDVKAEKNCLPLLEFALTELWPQRDKGKRELPLSAYTTMGRLAGALNTRAEAVFNDELASTEERDWAKRICLALVRIGPDVDVKDTRQRQPRNTLLSQGQPEKEQELIREVIEVLVDGRLLVMTKDEVDLAHEALMVGWERFAEWRQRDRDLRRLVQRINDAAKEWGAKGQRKEYLLQGGLLLEVKKQWSILEGQFSPNVKAFFHRSKEQEIVIKQAILEPELRERLNWVMQSSSDRPHEMVAHVISIAGENLRRLPEKKSTAVHSGFKKIFNTVHESGLFQGHSAYVESVAFSPDGTRIVSGSDDKTVRLWDLEGNAIGEPFQGHSDYVWSVAFSPDGTHIVSGSKDQTIRLWDLEGNAIGEPFQGHSDTIFSVAFSPDGTCIVSGSKDQTIRLWDLEGNAIGEPFQGHSDSVFSVAFSPDSTRIVSGSWDKTVRLWDLEGNAIGEPFQGHLNYVLSVAFSPDGTRIVSSSDDQTIRLWDLEGSAIGEPFQCYSAAVLSVAFSPDGTRIVSGSRDNTVRLWDLEGTAIGEPFQGHGDRVYSAAFSPDGTRIVSGSWDKTVRLWNLEGNVIGELFLGYSDVVFSVAFSPDCTRIVSGGLDATVCLWDLEGTAIGEPFQGHSDVVLAVAFSSDGTRIVSGSRDNTVRLWDLEGTAIGEPFQGHSDVVSSIAFSPDGTRIVSGSADQTVRLWDLKGTAIGEPFQGHSDVVSSVAFSPDGTRIVSGSWDKTVRLWDLKGIAIGEPFQGHLNYVLSVAFSPDGTRIVSSSDDQTIRLWDLEGTAIGEPFQGHSASIRSVAFSPDGTRIVSGSADQTVRLWDLKGTAIGEPFQCHSTIVLSVAFNPDGTRIVSGSWDMTVCLWRDGGWHDWLTLCCDRFRHHPLFKNPDREPFIGACEVCEKYVWNK